MSKEVLIQKLDLIVAELHKLQEIARTPREEYLSDYTKYYTGERIIEKIVGAAIDINTHLLVANGEKVPDTYYDSFIVVSRLGLFSFEFAQKIAQSARMRNKIIHEYEAIQEEQIYDSFDRAIEEYSKYVKYIEEFLKRK